MDDPAHVPSIPINILKALGSGDKSESLLVDLTVEKIDVALMELKDYFRCVATFAFAKHYKAPTTFMHLFE